MYLTIYINKKRQEILGCKSNEKKDREQEARAGIYNAIDTVVPNVTITTSEKSNKDVTITTLNKEEIKPVRQTEEDKFAEEIRKRLLQMQDLPQRQGDASAYPPPLPVNDDPHDDTQLV